MRITKLLLFLAILFSGQLLMAQTTLTGKITDLKTSAAIPNVSIIIKGSTEGTTSDNSGFYRLSIPKDPSIIIVSSLGYISQEINARGTVLNIALEPSGTRNLDEIVVVGFGTKIKKDLTGNIARVKGADVQNIPVANFTQALQGRAAGVYVQSQSGRVGEGVEVLIRGSGSISASNTPLYVVDGLPLSNSSISGNPLADINFNDIETFDILKDASAAAIYGSRAANGVVLITTKKGRSGKTVFQVNTQYGFNNPTNQRSFLDATQYINLLREAAINSDKIEGVDPIDPAQYPGSWLQSAERRLTRYSGWSDWRTVETNTDWQSYAFNHSSNTGGIDISASGGNDKTKFYTSLSYLNTEGILIGNSFNRFSGRVNLEQAVSDRFKIGFNFSLSQTTSDRVPADNEFSTPMQIVALSPVTPFEDLDGNVYNTPTTTYSNPYVDYQNGHYNSIIYRNIGNVFGQYNFNKNLFFRTEFGFDIQNQNDDEFYGFSTTFGSGTNGYGQSDWFRSLDYNVNNYFNFNKNFGKSDLEAVAGMSYQRYTSSQAQVYGEQFPVESLQKLASAAVITGGNSSETNSAIVSYFARANYKYNNKYLLTVSTRVDGSSVFGSDNRYGFFPAVSAGWILSEEAFIKNIKSLSFLKLRASWGLTGNDNGFGDFASLGLWGGATYDASGGLVSTQLANPNLGWEKSNQIDIGIDFGFFKNRLSGEIDYYNRKTNDLIYNVPVPSNTGFTSRTVNIGAMQNDGWEFVLNSDNIVKKDFKWSSSLNVSINHNKIVTLDGDQTIIPGNDGRYLNSLMVGQSIGVFYGPKFAGVDVANGDALYYTEDGKTTTNDYNLAGNFVVGNPNPDVIAGLSNTLTYKGFDFTFLFQGVFGNQIMNGAGGFMSASFDWYDNQTSDQLDRWQKPGDVTNVPQLRLAYGNGIGASSRYITDGDYVRLKNLTLGYNLPANILERIKLSRVRVYVSAINLLTFTQYDGWDPEVNTDYRANNRNQGADFYSAPQIKNFSFGLNFGF